MCTTPNKGVKIISVEWVSMGFTMARKVTIDIDFIAISNFSKTKNSIQTSDVLLARSYCTVDLLIFVDKFLDLLMSFQ